MFEKPRFDLAPRLASPVVLVPAISRPELDSFVVLEHCVLAPRNMEFMNTDLYTSNQSVWASLCLLSVPNSWIYIKLI